MTIKELAGILNVSPTTVSNVVNGHTEKMSEETRRKIERALIQYNFRKIYRSNEQPGELKLISVDFNLRFRKRVFIDPFCSELLDSICVKLQEYGRYPVCGSIKDTEEAYKKLQARNIEGGIVVGFKPWECEAFSNKVGKPVVFIDCGVGNYDNVGIEDYEGGKQITKFMLNQGHRKIAFFCDRKVPVSSTLERFQGYCAALSEYGISYSNEDYLYLPDDRNMMRETLRDFAIRAKQRGYTAVFVVSDYLANETIRVFDAVGLRVPDDISVTGFDDNFYANLSIPKLTTIRQSIAEKGEQAVTLLMQRIYGEEVLVNSFRLPVELIVRDSVKNITLPNT